MLKHVLKTLARMSVTFFVIVTLVFFATRITGNPVDFVAGEGLTQEDRALLIRYYKLDAPILTQYAAFLGAFVDGQFGLSFIERRPVAEIVVERLWPSLQLLMSAMLVTLSLAIPLGVAAAVWRRHWIGSAIMSVVFLGYAVNLIAMWRSFLSVNWRFR